MKKVEKYNHHNCEVNVISDIKGKHRDNCLCWLDCIFFHPDTENNCEIAKETFKNCVKFNTVTPVYECPKYERLVK